MRKCTHTTHIHRQVYTCTCVCILICSHCCISVLMFPQIANTHIYIYIYKWIGIDIHIYIYTYIYTYIQACTYIRTYIHTYIHTYVHTYIRTYVCIHTHIHIWLYVHKKHICMLYIDIQTRRPHSPVQPSRSRDLGLLSGAERAGVKVSTVEAQFLLWGA